MDYAKTLALLYAERDKLARAIALLEDLSSNPAIPPAARRGRKSMPAAERLEVSERMKRYWAQRRKAKGARA